MRSAGLTTKLATKFSTKFTSRRERFAKADRLELREIWNL